MKKLLYMLLLLIAVAPLCFYIFVKGNLDHYDSLGKQFDCYPFETCRPDIDGDSRVDFVAVFEDPLLPGDRLKVFLNKTNEKLEVLNIPFVSVAGSYRTHIAFFSESGVSKATIYDTVNPSQHYIWNGEELEANPFPSDLDTEIRTALGYNDDTGGFNLKVYFDLIAAALMIPFYILIAIIVGKLWFSARKRRSALA